MYLQKLVFKNSQIGYALNCDLIFSNRINLTPSIKLLETMENNSKIFISINEWPSNSDIKSI